MPRGGVRPGAGRRKAAWRFQADGGDMAGKPGCGGRKPLSIQELAQRGTFRRDRHSDLLVRAQAEGIVLRTFTCANQKCGNTQPFRSPTQRFCSVRCAAICAPKRPNRGGIAHTTRTCIVCGQSFHPKRKTSKLCSNPACNASWQRLRHDQEAVVAARRARRILARKIRAARGGRNNFNRWGQICARDGWICWICGQPIDPDQRFPHPLSGSCDHVVPLLLGGSDEDSNLRAAHFQCNSRRQAGQKPSAARS